ncbi:putative mitochondrial protein AtMg00240 [Silene latifolia]|uniref:putative mitochondrial protein AtMg00240 n=1 Tax=Silene latifolia TaxID=37657 RepID=UPI003D778AC7
MENCNEATVHMPRGTKLSVEQGELLHELDKYRRLIGKLPYLNLTRHDISYPVQHLSQFLVQSRVPHMQATIHMVRWYLKETINVGLYYPSSSDFQLKAHIDAN